MCCHRISYPADLPLVTSLRVILLLSIIIASELTVSVQDLQNLHANPPEQKYINQQQTLGKQKIQLQAELERLELILQEQKNKLEMLSKTGQELNQQKESEHRFQQKDLPTQRYDDKC